VQIIASWDVMPGRQKPYQRNVLCPSSESKNNKSKQPARNKQQTEPEQVVCLLLTLKMEAVCSSKMLANFYWTMHNITSQKIGFIVITVRT
jgi:hypothetical protein